MQSEHKHTNRLIHAASPYLLQHAHNPVDWYEWSEEAFEKARREDKLVLVSIGYSACHWCHVMERECFEQEDTAAIMNQHFVCIKVDREERPDVDQLYMDAVQLLTGRGGWPLNCFTLPDGRPIHGGTYFPKAEWERVLKSLADFYVNKREEAMQYATDLTNGVKKLDIIEKPANPSIPTTDYIDRIIKNWQENMDLDLGGFSWAPKFPMPSNWELFLQHNHYKSDEFLQQAVHTTLTKMAQGGIYDQVGGGFSRYSVDRFWKVPHFEKMLYDNAQLISLYTRAFQATKNPMYKQVVHETISFLNRDLRSEEGFYYSALDADSEGVEGKFYIWTQKELQEILGEHEPLFSLFFSVDAYGNWEHDANILYQTRSMEELELLTGKTAAEIEQVITSCKDKLLAVRAKRIAPGLDDKMITSWNALTIKALADAYLVFEDSTYLAQAEQLVHFIQTKLYDKTNGLKRIYKLGKASIHAFAEDYALLIEASIRLYEASYKEEHLWFAKQLMDEAITKFYATDKELFYFKANTDSQLVTRKLDVNDDVISSSNSVFAKCLWVLGFVFDETEYHQMAKAMVARIHEKLKKFPNGYSNWMQVIQWMNYGFKQIVVCGATSNHLRALHQEFIPNGMVLRGSPESTLPLLRDKQNTDELKVYICTDYTCGIPITELAIAIEQIKQQKSIG
jgi:uncharacterized protein YyaL (SSP411 family)